MACHCFGNVCNSPNAWSAPSHYLNQCWNIVNWTPQNTLQCNFNQNSYIFFQANPFENVVWKMVAILSRTQCVNILGDLCYAWRCSHSLRCQATNNLNTLRTRQNGRHFPDANAFCWKKMYEFRLRFHRSLFRRAQWTTYNAYHCFMT